jgi:hypothetical protein
MMQLTQNARARMKRSHAFLIATVCAVSTCTAADSAPAALVNKLESLAGASARDCGSVALGGDHDAAIACAKNATLAAKGYRVAVQSQGVDSLVWQGAARDPQGKLWVLFYDTDPSGGSGASPTLSVVPCREIRFEVHGGDLIDCQPISSKP